METVLLPKDKFDSLPEYSCSLPTGTTVGKQWKKDRWAFVRFEDGIQRHEWYLMEYTEHPDPKLVGIEIKRMEKQKH